MKNFLFYMQNTVQCLHRTVVDFMCLYMHNWNFMYIYDKILETHDYFQIININVVFILNNFLFYIQNNVQCLHHTLADFMCFI